MHVKKYDFAFYNVSSNPMQTFYAENGAVGSFYLDSIR